MRARPIQNSTCTVCVFVCVCVCVCARARARVCVCVCTKGGSDTNTNMLGCVPTCTGAESRKGRDLLQRRLLHLAGRRVRDIGCRASNVDEQQGSWYHACRSVGTWQHQVGWRVQRRETERAGGAGRAGLPKKEANR